MDVAKPLGALRVSDLLLDFMTPGRVCGLSTPWCMRWWQSGIIQINFHLLIYSPINNDLKEKKRDENEFSEKYIF